MLLLKGTICGRQIVAHVWVSNAWTREDPSCFLGLVDTGASTSGLSPHVADELGLIPTAWEDTWGPQGNRKDVPYYRVGMHVDVYPNSDSSASPHRHGSDAITAARTLGPIPRQNLPDVDVLVGMDFLQAFELCVERHSFRLRALLT